METLCISQLKKYKLVAKGNIDLSCIHSSGSTIETTQIWFRPQCKILWWFRSYPFLIGFSNRFLFKVVSALLKDDSLDLIGIYWSLNMIYNGNRYAMFGQSIYMCYAMNKVVWIVSLPGWLCNHIIVSVVPIFDFLIIEQSLTAICIVSIQRSREGNYQDTLLTHLKNSVVIKKDTFITVHAYRQAQNKGLKCVVQMSN